MSTNPKIYASYADARRMGGWRSDCARSPLPGTLSSALTSREARERGYLPCRKAEMTEYVLVASCADRGFRGRASKVYYSVWAK